MLVVTMLAHAFITFSASPHCHWAAVLIEPPPTRRSTPAARSSPVSESVILATASAPPANGNFPVAREAPVLRRRICGTTIVMERSPGVAASASRRATSSFSVPGPAWSTTWYFFDNSSLSVLAKASVSICFRTEGAPDKAEGAVLDGKLNGARQAESPDTDSSLVYRKFPMRPQLSWVERRSSTTAMTQLLKDCIGRVRLATLRHLSSDRRRERCL